MKLDDVLSAVHERRVLVFQECDHEECEIHHEPHFHQVLLTARQFKKVSDAIILSTRPEPSFKEGYDMATIRLDESVIEAEPFDGLSTTID